MPLKNKNAAREWFDTIFYGGLIAIIFRSLLLEPFFIPSGSMIPTLHVADHIFVKKWSYGYSRYSFPFGSWNLWNGRFFASHEPQVGDVIVFRKPDSNVEYVKRLVGKPGDAIQMKNGRLYINDKMLERKNPRPYIIANLPKVLKPVGARMDTTLIKGNKIWIDNAMADFNYTIEYQPDDVCKRFPGDDAGKEFNYNWKNKTRNFDCNVSYLTEYTEVLPNGVEHSIIERSDNEDLDNTEKFIVPENHYFFMGDDRDNSADSRHPALGFVNRDNVLGRVWFIWYSHNKYSSMLAFWNWGNKMRWERFGKAVK